MDSGLLIPGLILLPAIAGGLVLLIRRHTLRLLLVLAAAGATAVLALLVAPVSGLSYTPSVPLGLSWEVVVGIGEALLALVFLGLAIGYRHPLATALAAVQLVLVGWLELAAPGEAHAGAVFYLDRLSALMVLVVSLVGGAIAVYALCYMDEHEVLHRVASSRQPRFFAVVLLFLGAMNGLVMADDLRWLTLFWEITTLCSFLLIGHDGTPQAIRNALLALWMNLLGGVALALAMLQIEAAGGSLSLQATVGAGSASPTLLLALALLAFASFTKAAQMPFQGWFGAMIAPTPVSALLHSSTMVKAGVYLLLRLAPAYTGSVLSMVIAVAGAFTFLAAAVLAIGQSDGKRVLAYSTVSNLGLIIACAGIGTPAALTAGALLIVFHAVAKALLFLTVGAVEHSIGSRDVEDMQGLLARRPILALVAVIAIGSMILPPAGVQLAKWGAIEASSNLILIGLLFALGTAVTVVFWAKWMGRLFTEDPLEEPPPQPGLPATYRWTLLPLLAAVIALSAAVVPLARLLAGPHMIAYFGVPGAGGLGSYQAPAGTFLVWPLFLALGLGLLLPALLVRVDPEHVRPVYLGGENAEDLRTPEFRQFGDTPVPVEVGSADFTSWAGEDLVLRWANPAAVVLLLLLMGAAYL